jgi:Flp pilus assembly protein TadD
MQIWRDSLTLWRSVLQRNPQAAVAHANLGWSLIEVGQLQEAEAQLQQALAATPENPGVQTNLALIAFRRGDLDSAEPYARRAVALRPDDPEFRKNLAVLLIARGKGEEAIGEIRQALKLRDEVSYHLVLARALTHSWQRAAAVAELKALLERDPRFDAARVELEQLTSSPGEN